MTERDSDRARVYEAERSVRNLFDHAGTAVSIHGSTIVIPDERKFASIESIQTYVDRLMNHLGKPYGITVRERKGERGAHYEPWSNTIAIPDNEWARREIVVLHEVAHALSMGDGHGPKFRKAYADVMRAALGHEAEFLLTAAFFQFGLTLAS